MASFGASQTEAFARMPGRRFVLFLMGSIAVHGAALAILNKKVHQGSPPPQSRTLDLVMVEVAPRPSERKEEPKFEQLKPKIRPPPLRVAEMPRRPVKRDEPPPPNESAPKPTEAPLVVGLSLSSTTTADRVSLPTGNTLYGKPDARAQDPAEAKPYSAPRYTPFAQVDSRPEILFEVKIPYPEQAKHAAIEGDVVLSIDLDETGRVTAAKVLRGPGYGLNEAARDAIFKWKFKPATKNGAPTATTVPFTYHFVLN
jgi:periplasmic protein TonB